MLIFVEKKAVKLGTVDSFKRIQKILFQMANAMGQLNQALIFSQLREACEVVEEGKDADLAEKKIKELQSLVNQLDEVILLFESKEKVSREEIQKSLNLSQINLRSIRESMVAIWTMKTVGKTKEADKIIREIIDRVFVRVNILLYDIKSYVDEYNANNNPPLTFNVQWKKLPPQKKK